MKKEFLNILVILINPLSGYSGGRYHAWIMAEGIAKCNHKVFVWTNAVPAFINDFNYFPAHNSIKLQIDVNFEKPPLCPFDIIIVVPHTGRPYDFYYKAYLIAKRYKSRLILLNFETPNWFNNLSPEQRNPKLWRGWVNTSCVADLILSSTAESTKWAKQFYVSAYSNTVFRHCYPSINSITADKIKSLSINKKKQIICISRFTKGHMHKGGRELINAICPAMAGYILKIIVGIGEIDTKFHAELLKKAKSYGVQIQIKHNMSDREKFSEIISSELMLFLSFFEGFGYPPLEALYCGTPCVVYDIPVLREVSGNGLIYVPPGDETALNRAISFALSSDHQKLVLKSKDIPNGIKYVAKFEYYSKRLDKLIEEVINLPNKPAVLYASKNFVGKWKIEINLEKIRKEILKPIKFICKKINGNKN
ncbi:MAG: glycosyltransferase family 4 protein [Desulfobacterales bacterium]|nr:glycosyltransferase family 4 protein [Desulfobacterales bacterium]